MFPLVSAGDTTGRSLEQVLTNGMPPLAVIRARPAAFLRPYCEVYLNEEVQAEALVRQIGTFQRFLEVAARMNAQTVNITGIARDAGVARQTATDFFQILVDTGVARHLVGTAHLSIHPDERGALLETLLLHELRAWLHYTELHYPLAYWRIHSGPEVDFVIETSQGLMAIEVKSGK